MAGAASRAAETVSVAGRQVKTKVMNLDRCDLKPAMGT